MKIGEAVELALMIVILCLGLAIAGANYLEYRNCTASGGHYVRGLMDMECIR